MKRLSLNHYWRICAAGISYIVFALGAFVPAIYVYSLALFPISKEGKQQQARATIRNLCRFYIRFMRGLGLLSYEIRNPQLANVSGHLVIANHTMLIDALFILAYTKNLCCVVKSALCRNPVTRIPIGMAGYIPNDSSDLVELAKQKLQQGENVLIFPEGTRNQYDLQLDFKRGAANIAVISQVPILPITTCSTPRTLQKGQKWWQLTETKPHMQIHFNAPIRIQDCIDQNTPRTVQYRHLTQWLIKYYRTSIQSIIA